MLSLFRPKNVVIVALLPLAGTAVAFQVGGPGTTGEGTPPPDEPEVVEVEPYELPCGTAASFEVPPLHVGHPPLPGLGFGWGKTPGESTAAALEDLHGFLMMMRKVYCEPCYEGCEPIVFNLKDEELTFFTDFIIDPVHGEGFTTLAIYDGVVFDVWCTECQD